MARAPDPTPPESVQAKIDMLQSLLQTRIDGFTHYSGRFSGLHKNIALVLAGLAALNTFFVAVNESGILEATINFGLWALITSGLLTFVTTLESNIQAREKHRKNAASLNAVHDIKARLDWRLLKTEEPMTHEEIDAYQTEYRAVIKEFFGEFAEIGADP